MCQNHNGETPRKKLTPCQNSKTESGGPLGNDYFCTYCGRMGFGDLATCPHCGARLWVWSEHYQGYTLLGNLTVYFSQSLVESSSWSGGVNGGGYVLGRKWIHEFFEPIEESQPQKRCSYNARPWRINIRIFKFISKWFANIVRILTLPTDQEACLTGCLLCCSSKICYVASRFSSRLLPLSASSGLSRSACLRRG
jgi:hypothetical protein